MALANSSGVLSQDSDFFSEELNTIKIFVYHLWLCILIFGLASNTINIVVFVKIGFRDNVTVTLLFLSLSDLFNLMLNCPVIVARFMEKNHPNHDWPFDPLILYFGIYWWAYIFYDYSSFVSVFLALVRCACVSRPLRFKSMFTISRTVTILGVLFLVAVTLRAPVLTVFRLSWEVNPLTNSTFRSIQFVDNFNEIYKANDIINRNIVSWVAYIIAITCVIVLVSKLQAASRFRHSLQNSASGFPKNDESTLQNNKTEVSKNQKSFNKMSSKDLKVVQSVTLICVIFILSQMPFQIISLTRLLDPEFSVLNRKEQAYSFAAHISSTFGLVNSSVNIFVHYNFNARYRDTFLFFFSKKSLKV